MGEPRKVDTRTTECPICGGTEFEWGYMQGRGLDFRTTGVPLRDRVFPTGLRIRARRCKACENLQLFTG